MPANPNANAQMFYIRQSDGKAYCFSPVPLIQDSKSVLNQIKDGVETRLGVIHTLTFNGTFLPELPALSGVDENASCLELLDRKSDQLCAALDEDRGNLLIVDASGYPVLSVHPKVTSIDFPESRMVNKRDYTITFEYESDFSEDCKVREFNEDWDFSFSDDDTVIVNHNLSAIGISDFPAGSGALENAKYFVLQRANTLDKTKAAFQTSPFVPSIIDVDNLTEYNHFRTEATNEVTASYEISESWILASGAFKDDRTVETTHSINELGELTQNVRINGTVQGYGDTTFDRFNNATVGFNTVVSPEIGFGAITGIQSKARTDNRFAGSITYSLDVGDVGEDVLLDRQINRSFQRNDDGTTSQTVNTSARVRLTASSGIQSAIDYCYGNNAPLTSLVEPFYDANLNNNIESRSSERNELDKSFSLTTVYREQGTPLYREEYQVSRDRNVESALTTISVNGTVQGLAAETGTSSEERFNAASGAYFNTIQPLIRSRALTIVPTGSCIGSDPITDTLGYNKKNGTVSYSWTFDNRFLTDNSSILNENVEVTYKLAGDVVAEIPVPGKSTGPVLQDQETVTGLEKGLRITYRMRPNDTTCGAISISEQKELEDSAIAESNILVNNTSSEHARGEKPSALGVFKTEDNYSFSRRELVFSRNVTWKYTQT